MFPFEAYFLLRGFSLSPYYLLSTSHLRTGTRTPSSSLESALLATAHNAFPTWGAKGVARGHRGFVQGVGRGGGGGGGGGGVGVIPTSGSIALR